ncbi:MAG: serine/threonine-protein kinase, partial [Myxococcota bacterium]
MEQARIGAYRLDRWVGSGGMGEVWRAVHVPFSAPVAIKLLTGARAARASQRAAFRSEVRLAASLDHPGIVAIYDQGETEADLGPIDARTPYVVMEWLGGSSLAHASLPGWDALDALLRGLLAALAHAHAKRVIHRDLKPANLLLPARDGWGAVRIVDFGIAVLQGERADDDPDTSGTPAYMAPEQVRGAIGEQGPWTDLYALGCVAWRLATGRSVFDTGVRALTPVELLRAQLEDVPGRFEPRFDVPAGFEGWLRVLLNKRPSRRFACAADAAGALAALGDVVARGAGAVGGAVDALLADSGGTETFDFEAIDVLAIEPTPEPDLWQIRPRLPADWRPAVAGVGGVPAGGTGWFGPGLLGIRPHPLIGREAERDRLWSALRAVEAERAPRVIAIRGPTGAGKSRLGEWLVVRAREAGGIGLDVRHAAAVGREDGLVPMVLRQLGLGAESTDGTRESQDWLVRRISQLVRDPDDALVLAALAAPRHVPGVELREAERHAALLALVRGLVDRRPTALVIDDAQWGNDALGFVRHLLAVGQDPVLAVVIVRDDAVG